MDHVLTPKGEGPVQGLRNLEKGFRPHTFSRSSTADVSLLEELLQPSLLAGPSTGSPLSMGMCFYAREGWDIVIWSLDPHRVKWQCQGEDDRMQGLSKPEGSWSRESRAAGFGVTSS